MSEKSEIRDYSKKYFPEVRTETAQKIIGERKKLGKENDSLINIANAKKETIDSKEALANKIDLEIADRIEKLATKKQNSISKLINFLSIKNLQKEIEGLEATKQSIISDYKELNLNLDEINNYIGQLKDLKKQKPKEILDDFYSNQQKELEKYLDFSSIEKISRDKDVIFVHAIFSNDLIDKKRDHGNNNVFRGGGWKTFLAVLAKFKPTISTSTIKEGDTSRNMWFPFGVIINSGNVEAAMQSDGGTLATSLTKRSSNIYSRKELAKNIDDAIHERSSRGYNEIVVKNPEIAGIYYSPEKKPYGLDIKDVLSFAQQHGLPVYQFKDGKFHDMDDRPINKEEIFKYKFDKNTSQELFDRQIENDCPFKLPCFQQIDCHSSGEINYILLNLDKVKEKNKKILLRSAQVGKRVSLEKPEPNSNIPIRVYIDDISEFSEITGPKIRDVSGTYSYKLLGPNNKHIFINNNGIIEADKLDNNNDYIEAIKKYINKFKHEQLKENKKSEKAYLERVINDLLFNLHGFAKSAKQNGDEVTHKQCMDIILEYISDDDIKKIMKIINPVTGEVVASEEFIKEQLKLHKLLTKAID